ncbi:MMPL family transporter [Actinoallomurus purpureus]|uniref:MMPL family transporter n=1 Tax=Actinoallomurus purpureus TaxID=478114 RepID=UPI00209283BF|nr:MMPL family transporter [Actinoallomurus purpureus]MCO6010826.1 MMPL family transporter [Actinoallomurus purpureus]
MLIWVAAAVGTGVLGVVKGGTFVQQDRLTGTETQRSIDLLRKNFPEVTGPTATIVFHPQRGVSLSDWRVALQVGKAIQQVGALPRVSMAENPYGHTGGAKGANAVVAVAHFKGTARDLSIDDLHALEEATEPARQAGVDVDFGGIMTTILNQPTAGPKEGVGVILALGVLLFAFGSFLAAGVPIVVSLCAMAVAYSLIHFGAGIWQVHPTAPMVAAMLGLGAGIDYALFVVTRHRQQLAEGMGVPESVGRALATSGHAVVFAGGTVLFAICGLWFSGITFIGIIGLATAITVALMVAGALTLLPAVLGALGTNIDRYRLPWLRPDRSTYRWERWGRHVDRHAWPYAIGATLLLLFLALPVLSLRFGIMADSTLPHSNGARRAYDVTAKEFGPGWYSPFVVVATVPGPVRPPQSTETTKTAKGWTALRQEPGGRLAVSPNDKPTPNPEARRLGEELRRGFQRVPGVASVEAPVVAGDSATVKVVPTTPPQAAATADLVRRLRRSVIPPIVARHPGARAYLGGESPAIIDMATIVKQRMPYVVIAVVAVALVLLVIAFRSIIVPIKAALMNLLSIGAAYGVVVAVFQWGWGIDLLGLDQPVPIVSFVPLFMFALLFGLSMDYEVFLLSRIREEYLRTDDPHGSVVTGIASTARLITSAALIMICVFLSFLPQPDSTVKMMGLGLAAAVAVDATIVRLVLVPALMSLLGHANWWFPGRRRRPAPPAARPEERTLEHV